MVVKRPLFGSRLHLYSPFLLLVLALFLQRLFNRFYRTSDPLRLSDKFSAQSCSEGELWRWAGKGKIDDQIVYQYRSGSRTLLYSGWVTSTGAEGGEED